MLTSSVGIIRSHKSCVRDFESLKVAGNDNRKNICKGPALLHRNLIPKRNRKCALYCRVFITTESVENTLHPNDIKSFLAMNLTLFSMRELTEQFLRGRITGMKLLDQYEAACKVRRFAVCTIQTYRQWVEEFLRFHRDRTGRWIHPKDLGKPFGVGDSLVTMRHIPIFVNRCF